MNKQWKNWARKAAETVLGGGGGTDYGAYIFGGGTTALDI